MPRSLAALSASVVAAIYTAGYIRTQPVDMSLAASEPIAQSVATTLPTPTTQPSTAPTAKPTATQPAPTPAPATTTATTLKDGTFSGQGTSRRGNVWVDVTVQNGRIVNVTISRSTLQYPVRDIAGLPAEVVSRQTANVDIVSGATYSSQAFRAAVTQALNQAKA